LTQEIDDSWEEGVKMLHRHNREMVEKGLILTAHRVKKLNDETLLRLEINPFPYSLFTTSSSNRYALLS
jgi:hypothetical protein